MQSDFAPLQKAVAKAFANKTRRREEQALAQEVAPVPVVDTPDRVSGAPFSEKTPLPEIATLPERAVIASKLPGERPATEQLPAQTQQEPDSNAPTAAPAQSPAPPINSAEPAQATPANPTSQPSANTPTRPTTQVSGGDAFAFLLQSSEKAEMVGVGTSQGSSKQSAPTPMQGVRPARADDVEKDSAADNQQPEPLEAEGQAGDDDEKKPSLRSWFSPKKDPNPPAPPTTLPD